MKKAFTLAEVLITLTIIGVIAALTIPNLIQSYRKHQIETGLKSAYTLLQNAITMAQAEHGSLEEIVGACSNGSSFAEKANCFTNNYLKPYLKYSNSCGQGENNCKAVFPTNSIKKLDGTISVNFSRLTPSLMSTIALTNGILVGIQWEGYAAPEFIVDVNGWKGPNQLGTDVFYFNLKDGTHGNIANGLRCSTFYNNPTAYYTYRECSHEGYNCSCPIMYNGWKIPDNYPVKKF